MDGSSRDFLCGIGKGDAPPPEQRPGQPREAMEEDVELSLELSLGRRSGLASARKGDKLPRSSSAAAMMTPVEVPAPPAHPRASGSPSSASSQGDGQRLQGNGTLMRTSSLPAVIEAAGNEEWKKRKEAQSLKRLEVNKKRLERRNSLTCSTSKEAAGQITEETDKLVSCDEAVLGNNENHSSGKHLAKGLPPNYQATSTSQDSLSAMGKKPSSAFKGTAVTEEHGSSSSVPSSSEAIRSMTAASPPPPLSLAPRTAATLGSRGDQSILGRDNAVLQGQTAWGDVERRLMQEMPGVYTSGLPNGKRVEGFLYKYRKEDGDVKIVCICHGSFLTPREFVEHAGADNGKVDNPLQHIVIRPTPTL